MGCRSETRRTAARTTGALRPNRRCRHSRRRSRSCRTPPKTAPRVADTRPSTIAAYPGSSPSDRATAAIAVWRTRFPSAPPESEAPRESAPPNRRKRPPPLRQDKIRVNLTPSPWKICAKRLIYLAHTWIMSCGVVAGGWVGVEMPEFDVEAFVSKLERLGVKLTSVPLADGKVRINRWRMLNAGNNNQQIQDLWNVQIGENQAHIDLLAAYLAHTAPPVTASRMNVSRAMAGLEAGAPNPGLGSADAPA